MDKNLFFAALFDFDGTVVDTEPQYSQFWGEQGRKYHPEIPRFDLLIKGQTLSQIFSGHFHGMDDVQAQIRQELDQFEAEMNFPYIPGAKEFITHLRDGGIRTAIVTSSDDKKMANAFREHPELHEQFDLVLTADMFTRSKPDPDCFLTAASRLGCKPSECVVFEDSLFGLQAGRSAGMRVVGLTTTNPSERVSPLADLVWPDFTGMSLKDL